MEQQDFCDAVDGLWAYDSGAVDSGIHDELLRQKVKGFLREAPEKALEWLGQLASHLLAGPYTLEDVHSLIDWLDRRMEFHI